ncbi:putative zinc-ribbon domain, plant, protein enhanced disease resistance 4 [Helianthus annuus]|nr:putative zinc-ribbon domain, plant, protein enhanced disease resistance 4 [Helianthus annuus]
MAGKMNSKVRLVRCPKCLNVLPEPPDVPVYTCGGCGARLQAKKRNKSTVDTTSQRPDEGSSGKQKVDSVFIDQEASSSSNQQSLISSIDESVQNSDHNGSMKDQDAANTAENGTVIQLKMVSSSDEPDQNIHNDPRSSTEFSGHEDPQSSPEATSHKGIDQEQEQSQSDYQDTVVGLEHSSAKQKTEQLSADNNDCNVNRSSSELSYHEKPESSPEAAAHSRIDQQQEQEQEQEQNQSRYQDAGKQQENVTVAGLGHSSGKQKTEQLSDENELRNRFAHLLLVNPRNELDRNNDRNEGSSSSELSYHDDPVSSPEATAHNRVKQQETEFVSCRKETGVEKNGSEFEETIADMRIVSDSDSGSKSSFRSVIAEKRQKKAVCLDEDDLLSEDGSTDLRHQRRFGRISSAESMETARLGGTSYYGYEGSVSSFDGNDDQIPRKNRIGSIRDEVDSGNRSRVNWRNDRPLNGRVSKYEQRSTDVRSFYGLNEFHENPRHRPSMIPENPQMERTELLKLVRELQDQLERTNISNPQQVPSYYNHLLNNPGRYGQRMAFSGEAVAVNRRRDGSSCHHCCPQDRHFSAQLPSHHVCCHGPNYGPSSYRSPHFSGPSSPKHIHSESDFSAPDDHWQQSDVRKPFRSPRKKQYVRPIAGGSPWITCYRCFKILQLPQSFLLFDRRYHSLKCGACMKVLNFTLSDGTHVSRYNPDETVAAPPSSEAEDYDKLAGSWAGPVSCSDRSFEKSYSTETDRNGSRSREFSEDRRKATMSRDPSGSTRPPSSRFSGRRLTTSEIEEVGPGPGPNGSPGSCRPPSSRNSGRRTTTSEIEEVGPGHNGSPLHWLMGYASPSKVIRGL